MPRKRFAPLSLRHVTSINDLSMEEVERIFRFAGRLLDQQGDAAVKHRIAHSSAIAKGKILASLFYEPSTRTRLSFESAMLRLGGTTMASADPATSSAAKGESLADSVRIVSNYADILVLRHPRDGAARLAAEYAGIPVVNGGDGAHEHPTQTLCDLFTLKRQQPRKFKDLNVAISGDLRGSRTIHSFVYALARFGASLILMPAPGMELPAHVFDRLKNEFHCEIGKGKAEGAVSEVDALYVTPNRPHQLSLIANTGIELGPDFGRIDVVYVTRFQKERWKSAKQGYVKIDAKFLEDKKYAHTKILHPLPRVGELDVALDRDERAVYFEQAAYGVPVRMSLIAHLLGLGEASPLERFATGFAASPHPVYDRAPGLGGVCANPNCIVHDEFERPHCRDRFHVHEDKLRCVYCETDIAEGVTGDPRMHKYRLGLPAPDDAGRLAQSVFFASSEGAEAAGYRALARGRAHRAA